MFEKEFWQRVGMVLGGMLLGGLAGVTTGAIAGYIAKEVTRSEEVEDIATKIGIVGGALGAGYGLTTIGQDDLAVGSAVVACLSGVKFVTQAIISEEEPEEIIMRLAKVRA